MSSTFATALAGLCLGLTACGSGTVEPTTLDGQAPLALSGTGTHAEPLTAHLEWGEKLVATVTRANNSYGTQPSFVRFEGVKGATVTETRNVCSTFVTNLIKHAYGIGGREFKAWIDSTSPFAEDYHDAIVAENHFQRIRFIADIRAGDLLSVKFFERSNPYTGHMAIVAGEPRVRSATAPFVFGTTQYELPVVDTSQTGHGRTDTRLRSDGYWHAGAGKGIMRLYADKETGEIVGHTWSTRGGPYYRPNVRSVVIGRLERFW